MPDAMLRSSDLVARLAARYRPHEWAFFEQVPNATGGRAGRTADALAMNLWPSRGLEIHGFEVKVSRNDWLRELKAPQKAEEIAAYCDRWWLVVSEAKIVQPGELPPTWGLLGPRGDGLVVVVDAPALAPKPVDRDFLAAILRRASSGFVPASEVESRIAAGEAAAEERHKAKLEAAQERVRDLEATIETFKTRSGVDIDAPWALGDISDAVRSLVRGSAHDALRGMEAVRGHAERVLAEMDEHIAAVRSALQRATGMEG